MAALTHSIPSKWDSSAVFIVVGSTSVQMFLHDPLLSALHSHQTSHSILSCRGSIEQFKLSLLPGHTSSSSLLGSMVTETKSNNQLAGYLHTVATSSCSGQVHENNHPKTERSHHWLQLAVEHLALWHHVTSWITTHWQVALQFPCQFTLYQPIGFLNDISYSEADWSGW